MGGNCLKISFSFCTRLIAVWYLKHFKQKITKEIIKKQYEKPFSQEDFMRYLYIHVHKWMIGNLLVLILLQITFNEIGFGIIKYNVINVKSI